MKLPGEALASPGGKDPDQGGNVMRRLIPSMLVVLTAGAIGAPVAWAGSPHFVGAVTATRTDNSLTVSGKEAGLGDEEEVNILVTATAECINQGENVPVQNGKANFSLTVTATLKPSCSPPMTLAFTDVTVTDTTNGISTSLTGTF